MWIKYAWFKIRSVIGYLSTSQSSNSFSREPYTIKSVNLFALSSCDLEEGLHIVRYLERYLFLVSDANRSDSCVWNFNIRPPKISSQTGCINISYFKLSAGDQHPVLSSVFSIKRWNGLKRRSRGKIELLFWSILNPPDCELFQLQWKSLSNMNNSNRNSTATIGTTKTTILIIRGSKNCAYILSCTIMKRTGRKNISLSQVIQAAYT